VRDPIGAPASWLARAIRDGRLSSEEVVRAHLQHIGQVNPRLNAMVWVTNESAIRQAKAADRKLAKRGFDPPPLHGVPFTAKDIFDTAGVATTAGLRKLKNNVPDRDATVIARMRSAGAILLGKSNCPPGGSGGESWNPLHGGTRNPYDLTRSPGASSSGEAAIIAAAGSPLGIGSDSGGSIRLPAHYCGIAALKPTTGWVPSTGAYGLVGGLMDPRSQVGPMARFVNDLALVLPILCGPDGIDSAVIPMPPRRRRPQLKGLKVAWYTDDGLVPANKATVAAVQAAVRALAGAGCRVTEARPPGLKESRELSEGYWGRVHMTHERLISRWDAFRTTLLGFMSSFDLIVTPVSAEPAPLYRGKTLPSATDDQYSYTVPYSLGGNPAAVVRAGTSPEGLPIGVQVVARNWRDYAALAAAAWIERQLGGWQPASLGA
jgi:amidase